MLRMFWQIERMNSKMGLLESKANISRSLVRNFLSILYNRMSHQTTTYDDVDMLGNTEQIDGATNTAVEFALLQMYGNAYTRPRSSSSIRYRGVHVGIVIGEGQTGVTAAENAYNPSTTQYDHGTGTDEFIYMGGSIRNPVVSAPYTYVDFDRIFYNDSGGSIVVKELAINVFYDEYCYLICRDPLDSLDWVTVNDGEYLKVTYRMRVST